MNKNYCFQTYVKYKNIIYKKQNNCKILCLHIIIDHWCMALFFPWYMTNQTLPSQNLCSHLSAFWFNFENFLVSKRYRYIFAELYQQYRSRKWQVSQFILYPRYNILSCTQCITVLLSYRGYFNSIIWNGLWKIVIVSEKYMTICSIL